MWFLYAQFRRRAIALVAAVVILPAAACHA